MATDILRVSGGRPLSGIVPVEGAKNAALPACVASLLTDEPVTLSRIPELRDVSTILFTLSDLGKRVVRMSTSVVLGSDRELSCRANAYAVRQMRASFLVLGPLLVRLGCAEVPLPGGCAIGSRSVDLHIQGLRTMGARVEERGSLLHVTARRLRGAPIKLGFPSVGATEHLLMAASLAQGETEIVNGSIEPEVEDLVRLLRAMGASIEREDSTYRVEGADALHGASHAVIPDRMEAGTYLLAGAITGGRVGVDAGLATLSEAFLAALSEAGCQIESCEGTLHVRGRPVRGIRVRTEPHPGFPTDLHPPLAALLCLAEGTSTIEESIFEHRHTYVDGLRALGGALAVEGTTVRITGVTGLKARRLMSPDIRSGAALLLGALAAQGESELSGLDKIDRGYSRLADKLRLLGAEIERETERDTA